MTVHQNTIEALLPRPGARRHVASPVRYFASALFRVARAVLMPLTWALASSVAVAAAPSERAAARASAPAVTEVAPEQAAASPEATAASAQTVPPPTPDARVAEPEEMARRARPLTLFGEAITPGERRRLSWSPPDTFEGLSAPTPVLVSHGSEPGPVLCLTGAVHGDEINGIEIIRRVFSDLDPEALAGSVIGIPIVNQVGFRRGSRYLPDRRDLNRYFPGTRDGSSASRIAHSLFYEVIVHCDLLVDLHTGSFHRTNLPQLRADLAMPQVKDLAAAFGGMVVVHSVGTEGTLRREASHRGIPTVTLEAGEAQRVQVDVVRDGAARIGTLMHNLGMTRRLFRWPQREPTYLNSRWFRAEQGGLFISRVDLGEHVESGEELGVVVDPITGGEAPLVSPWTGRVLGMALNQVVRPGYALFHFGIGDGSERAVEDADAAAPGGAGREVMEAEMD